MLTATPGSESVPVEGTCFQSVEVTSKALESGDVEVTLHLGLPTSLLCHASFILATDKHIELEEVALNNIHSLIIRREELSLILPSLIAQEGRIS